MRGSYYDVVVLGRRSGCLAAAAILAKRGLRVCVLGQGEPGPTFRSGGRDLPRYPFRPLPERSVALHRVLRELAALPIFRRDAEPFDPAIQLATPRDRVDFWSDTERRLDDLDRRFPEVDRAYRDLEHDAHRISRVLDRLMSGASAWPPTTFRERREFARARVELTDRQAGSSEEALPRVPAEHPLALAITAAHRFSDTMDQGDVSPIRRIRPWTHWITGPSTLPEGKKSFDDLILERLQTYGGTRRDDEPVTRITPRRSHRDLVLQLKSGEELGAGHVIVGTDTQRLSRWLTDTHPIDALYEACGEPSPQQYRYSMVAVVAPEGIPPGLGRHTFVVLDPSKPLRDGNLLALEHRAGKSESMLIMECLVHRTHTEDVDHLRSLRTRVRSAVKTLLPFLDRHIRWADSPYDDLGAERPDGSIVEPEDPWTRGPKWMEAIYRYRPSDPLGVCGLPCRTGFKRLLLCNGQVIPGLGLEGELLNALTCARIVTRSNRRLMWMRRGLWTKAEV